MDIYSLPLTKLAPQTEFSQQREKFVEAQHAIAMASNLNSILFDESGGL